MTQVLQYVNAMSPIGYTVADAQNVIIDLAVKNDFEWLLLIEDDTMPPPDAFLRLEAEQRGRRDPLSLDDVAKLLAPHLPASMGTVERDIVGVLALSCVRVTSFSLTLRVLPSVDV
jgi:hypothetical protein